MDDNDPLRSLLADDTKEVDRQKLAEFLKPFVKIDSSSKEFFFFSDLGKKSVPEKIEIILLASKVRSLIFEENVDGMLPKEIIALERMPAGSVKTGLKTLHDQHKIKKDQDGRYYVPGYRLSAILEKAI